MRELFKIYVNNHRKNVNVRFRESNVAVFSTKTRWSVSNEPLLIKVFGYKRSYDYYEYARFLS